MTLFVVSALSIPLVGLWIQGGPWPNRQMTCFFIAVLAWAPLFLAASKRMSVFRFNHECQLVPVLLWARDFVDFDGRPGQSRRLAFCVVYALVFTVGLWAMIYAYRSWLKNDVG